MTAYFRARSCHLSSERGYSFVELLVVTVILLILASAVVPLSQLTVQRQRESELRRALREIRTAIDAYKDAVDLGVIGGTNVDSESEGYPPNLGHSRRGCRGHKRRKRAEDQILASYTERPDHEKH